MYCGLQLRSREKIMLLPLCYILLATVIWGFAFYFFMAKLTSWEVSDLIYLLEQQQKLRNTNLVGVNGRQPAALSPLPQYLWTKPSLWNALDSLESS